MAYDLLMVDDEVALAESTTEHLTLSGIPSTWVESAEAALAFLQHNDVAVILLDINLPGMSGYDFCLRVRREHDVPILFVSARESDDDQIMALSLGGDDYIRKPYSLSVLLARVRRTLARLDHKPLETGRSYEDEWLKVDAASNRIFVAGTELVLTAMEHKLLRYLVDNAGRVVSKKDIFADVWQEPMTSDGTLTVHIRRLRKKIEQNPDDPRYLRTIWGRGYMFEGDG